MKHLPVFLGITLGSILGLFILGGHYYLMFLNIMIPICSWYLIFYLIKN